MMTKKQLIQAIQDLEADDNAEVLIIDAECVTEAVSEVSLDIDGVILIHV